MYCIYFTLLSVIEWRCHSHSFVSDWLSVQATVCLPSQWATRRGQQPSHTKHIMPLFIKCLKLTVFSFPFYINNRLWRISEIEFRGTWYDMLCVLYRFVKMAQYICTLSLSFSHVVCLSGGVWWYGTFCASFCLQLQWEGVWELLSVLFRPQLASASTQ